MRQLLFGLGAGLFLAGVFSFFYIENITSPPKETPVKENINKEKPANTQEQEPVKKKESPQVSEQKEQPKSTETIYQLKIYSGATPSSIASDLQAAGIVDNKEDIEIFLNSEPYATSIQVGVFNITANMTIEDIAELITKQ